MANDARILGESYNGRFQRRLGELFVEVVHEILPSVAGLLQEKAGLLSRGELTADACAALSERADAAGVLEQLSEFDAKLVDVQWRARKAAGIDIVIAVNELGTVATGDCMSEVVGRFRDANLDARDVQELVDHAVAWPSLTTHPTNPTSLQVRGALPSPAPAKLLGRCASVVQYHRSWHKSGACPIQFGPYSHPKERPGQPDAE